MTTASAPGKVILIGEHAVVYGRPALAVPVSDLRARVRVEEGSETGVRLRAAQIDFDAWLHEMDEGHPLRRAVDLTLEALQLDSPPSLELEVDSDLPIAAGLGSGAAVTIAIMRGLGAHYGRELPPSEQSTLAFEVEKLHHGTPSGIDNTVIAYGQPVSLIRGADPRLLQLGAPFCLVLGDTGESSPTARAVAGVRQRREQDPKRYEALFDEIADLAIQAREALQEGQIDRLGPLLDRNQSCLEQLGVSTERLEKLIDAARAGGALGAKLSGAGLGGIMLALVEPSRSADVAAALRSAGAAGVYETEVRP